MLFGDLLHLGEAPRLHRRCPDITRLAGFHDIVQRLHRLFHMCLVVEAVDLEQVEIHAEANQAVVDRLEERLARQAARIWRLSPRRDRLGRDPDLVAESGTSCLISKTEHSAGN